MRVVLFVALVVTACGGVTDIDVPVKRSVCTLPATGGFSAVCDESTHALAAWYWLEATQDGEQARACTVATCPTGATCIVQSDVSGLDDGGALLVGTCE